MKEIEQIIELQTNTNTERLTFETRYLVQINFTFEIFVQDFKILLNNK